MGFPPCFAEILHVNITMPKDKCGFTDDTDSYISRNHLAHLLHSRSTRVKFCILAPVTKQLITALIAQGDAGNTSFSDKT